MQETSLEHPELPAGVEPTPLAPRWPARRAPLALLTAIGASLACGLIVYLVAAATGVRTSPTPASVNLISTLLQDVCFIGGAMLIAAGTARPQLWHFGLRPTRLWPAVGWGALVWVGFLILTALWTVLMEQAFGITEQRQNILDDLGVRDGSTLLIATALLVCVMAPLAEEFLFRGFVFTALRSWRGIWPAAVITGIVFGGVHVLSSPAVFIVPLAIFGFGLCLLYVRTGSLYPCIAVHALNNSVAFGVTEGWSALGVVGLAAGAFATLALILTLARRLSSPAPDSAGRRPVHR
ncbi:unannotated protein [freshwater metagenome]|uniref:Unannotated protein n=1 Tax=freshwater metagenome TaxID=449393 RepID=A0A6J7CHS0_9ZZZZ|nr:CPBP family intramembrane metalloprotease [Actinomycetota bacterium]